MINPKSLVSALHSHWEVMIALTTLSREYPAFSSEMVLQEIAKAHTTKNQEAHEVLLRQLIGTELLSLHSRSNTLEIHPLVPLYHPIRNPIIQLLVIYLLLPMQALVVMVPYCIYHLSLPIIPTNVLVKL